ncbi:ANTAR domain-containing protein [Streptomyces sp. TRM66268-LWL]|uniref:ANTAR domain-containing protein n=1 Tax=Streptomyces polyasparticus TaxID=2767826 RepID=A0ABR7SJV2_9ACTN|nr:ANTAR domain-containing protein [Streptomyces polyasparticus]
MREPAAEAGELRSEADELRSEADVLRAEAHELRVENEQLRRALNSRAVIDQARGMLMVLAPCSSERAWSLLVDVSQHGNVRLRVVAAALVATAEGEAFPDHLRRELRGALRRLHATERRDG